MKPSVTFFAVLFSALSAAVFSAQAIAGHNDWRNGHAPRHEWARDYAETALRQARKARTRGCSFHGNRWSMSYRQHFDWATRADRYDARREIKRRDDLLRQCRARHAYAGNRHHDDPGRRHHNGRHDNDGYRHSRSYDHGYSGDFDREDFARWYADTATGQTTKNHRLGCGGRGNAWTRNWSDHYRWALNVRRAEALREVENRDHHLSQCGRYAYRG
jgi:hypothetical protein